MMQGQCLKYYPASQRSKASQLNQLFDAFPKVLGIMWRPFTLESNLFYLKDNTQYPKNAVKQYASSKNS